MKWIFALLFLFSVNSFAVESVPADISSTPNYNSDKASQCFYTGALVANNVNLSECVKIKNGASTAYGVGALTSHTGGGASHQFNFSATFNGSIQQNRNWVLAYYNYQPSYSCPPNDNPSFTVGPVDLNGSKVCQTVPKVCMMGSTVRIQGNGAETCVSNCSSAAGLAHQSRFFYQAGPNPGSTSGEVKCYGQCSIQTVGGGVQLTSGAWTGNFTFTGANCPVIRPEPTVDSESDTGGNGNAPAVDESTTSEGTDNALGELSGAASSATGSQVQPSATGPDGTSTLNDVAQTVADAANAQIQATSSQNVATGNLIANTTKDLQNTIIRTGSVGASSVLQAQGNSKLDGIGSAIGEGNGKLDGIKSSLDEISDKLDEPGEETPFVPGAGSGAFWESILPESSFTEIKDKQAQSIQDMKDLSTEFQDSISFTDLSASGAPDEWSLNVHGTALPFGLGAFQLLIDMGIAAIVLFLCALYTIYIITSRK
ncbi:hypothetical protein ACW5W4_00975 [Aeromonas crassostreae]